MEQDIEKIEIEEVKMEQTKEEMGDVIMLLQDIKTKVLKNSLLIQELKEKKTVKKPNGKVEEEKTKAAEVVVDPKDSVKISVNAKGQFSGEVKCYALTPDEAMEQATKLVVTMEAIIREKNNL